MTRENTDASPLHEGEGGPVAWRYRYPNDPTWQLTQDHDQAFKNTGEVEPLGVIPFAAPLPSVEVERLREALEPFADIGQWLFARDLPDETPVVEIVGLNGSRGALTRGMFKAAHTAIAALSRKQEPGVPTPGEWIEWSGGENPVPGQLVDTRFRGDPLSEGHSDPSGMWTWKHDGDDGDIIAYRIVPTPGGEGE